MMTKMKKKFHRWYHIVRVPNDCLVILSGKEIEKPVKEQSIVGEQKSRKKYKEYEMDDFQKFLTGHLTPAKNVSHVKTALAIRSSKQLVGVPIDQQELEP